MDADIVKTLVETDTEEKVKEFLSKASLDEIAKIKEALRYHEQARKDSIKSLTPEQIEKFKGIFI